ncbi:TetR/AcrR family transcriptional regulator [Streptomyces sp. NBC_00365]|uniref:TetR/AcrR family transcriptional regulator n=1 Tax=Streptomyces sp. NBC_00365 TaxID=2975726 RepID=UPI002257321C|nr:TetR/AcrR family transcriptional regulator [Streptomyces sp. NBC_00365]MCX5095133.1 TetR/AcrR family transcriptional regulator [Streptomyces sp. NBC_00365]
MATESRTGPGPRDRFRAQVREEVKAAALRQLADGGPEALSLNAIAKQLGMTGPALYRYFANRDSLLTELVIDAYADMAATLARAAGAAASDATARLAAVVRAYRDWARSEPHRYRLLFRAPLPGYDAQSTRLVEASQPAMNVVLNVTSALAAPGTAAPEGSEGQFGEWLTLREVEDVPAAVAARTTMLWAHLHGLVSLEIEQNFASMGVDPTPLYEEEVRDFARSL